MSATPFAVGCAAGVRLGVLLGVAVELVSTALPVGGWSWPQPEMKSSAATPMAPRRRMLCTLGYQTTRAVCHAFRVYIFRLESV